MIKIFLFFIFSIGYLNIASAALPDYITKDTFSKICRKVECPMGFSTKYINTYYHKQFHKALAISTIKRGSKYTINHASWSFQYPSAIKAKSEALRGCRKKSNNCEIFLVNLDLCDKILVF